MDIQRSSEFKLKKKRRQIAIGVGVLVLVGLVSVGVSKIKPAAPSVDRAAVWIDQVKRGSMTRQVRGLGTLAPEEIRYIPAMTDGRVEAVRVRPGAQVKADTILVELSNPQVEQAALDAKFQLLAAEAEYNSLRVQLQSQVLSQKAEAARAEAEYSEARMRAETDAELAKLGVISGLTLKVSEVNAQQLGTRSEIEKQRFENSARELEARLAAQRSRVDQLQALYNLQQTQLEALKIRAGSDGVLQGMALNGQTLQVGQQVTAGASVAIVANPTRLKAEVRVPETQAKDVQIGLPAVVDTRNGVVQGRVVRIDPAVQNGTVTVDIALEGELPPGARPDLSVEGTISLEKLENVLYVGRPAFGQEQSTVSMFRLQPDGTHAERAQVQMGRSSVNTVEIVAGLQEGDRVILSDMSRWDNADRIRLD